MYKTVDSLKWQSESLSGSLGKAQYWSICELHRASDDYSSQTEIDVHTCQVYERKLGTGNIVPKIEFLMYSTTLDIIWKKLAWLDFRRASIIFLV